jgi:hypothetical protein
MDLNERDKRSDHRWPRGAIGHRMGSNDRMHRFGKHPVTVIDSSLLSG